MKALLVICFWLLMGLLAFCGWKAWEQALAYERETLHVIERLDANERLESVGHKLLEAMSFGLYDGYSKELKEIQRHQSLQRAYRDSAWIMTGGFFILIPLALGLAYGCRRDWNDLAYAMLGISIIALVAGLITPILSISAAKELPVLGETVFQFQSKGILSTIQGLHNSGNGWLAALLFLFSVLIPFLKTGLVALTAFVRTHHITQRGLKWSKSIGKWSMADVFVVAILVAFFANEGNGLTQAEVQVGLCFFAGYVVLSLLGTQIIGHRLKVDK